jgi:hypothetical protein
MHRWHVVAFAVGSSAALAACSSGDGVPTATIESELRDVCVVEASFLGYYFQDPIGYRGSMSQREVTVGSDLAYAVSMQPAGGKACSATAQDPGGKLWVTKQKYTAKGGANTRIVFSQDSATVTEPCKSGRESPDYRTGRTLFNRLAAPSCNGTSPPDSGPPDAPVDTGDLDTAGDVTAQ